jgi:hypothetical protein
MTPKPTRRSLVHPKRTTFYTGWKAGIHSSANSISERWIPAFARMTVEGAATNWSNASYAARRTQPLIVNLPSAKRFEGQCTGRTSWWQ